MRKIQLALAAASFGLVTMTQLAAAQAIPGGALTPTVPTAPADTTPAATTAGTATAPATMTAEQVAVKDTMAQFQKAILDGDPKGEALGYLKLPEVDAKHSAAEVEKYHTAVEVMFGEIIAEQRLHNAVAAKFKEKAGDFKTGMRPEEIADFNRQMNSATVTLNDKKDEATLRMGPGPGMVLVQVGGQWKIDFERTQNNIGPLPTDDVPTLRKLTEAYNKLAGEVAAGKYANVDDVTKEVDKAKEEAVKAAATKPAATAPAATTTTAPKTQP